MLNVSSVQNGGWYFVTRIIYAAGYGLIYFDIGFMTKQDGHAFNQKQEVWAMLNRLTFGKAGRLIDGFPKPASIRSDLACANVEFMIQSGLFVIIVT